MNYFVTKNTMQEKLILNQTTGCGPRRPHGKTREVPWKKELGARLNEEYISSPFHPPLGPYDIV
jgi:hypothetical protein